MRITLSLLALFIVSTAFGQTLQERLGYNKESKLLIIHADDLGVSHAENAASFRAMQNGMVSSASIMVPCPWFPEVADYARNNPAADLGIHLTFTSEWKNMKWGPVLPIPQVPGLVNRWSYMYESVDSVYASSNVSEIEKEIRAQVQRAIDFDIDVTHLDSHMGTLYGDMDYLQAMIRVGREYQVPVMLRESVRESLPEGFLSDQDVMLNGQVYIASPSHYDNAGLAAYYESAIQEMQPGVHVVLLHAAFENEEMKALTIDHPHYGAKWRQQDFDFFSSEKCEELLKENNIKVITWKEIRDKLLR